MSGFVCNFFGGKLLRPPSTGLNSRAAVDAFRNFPWNDHLPIEDKGIEGASMSLALASDPETAYLNIQVGKNGLFFLITEVKRPKTRFGFIPGSESACADAYDLSAKDVEHIIEKFTQLSRDESFAWIKRGCGGLLSSS